MDANQMQRQFLEYTTSLFNDGYLDNQFKQLQQLQDESNPDFVAEVVTLFFVDSERILDDLTLAFDQQHVDLKKVDAHVHQLKGSSSSIGAQKVKDACVDLRYYCEMKDVISCRTCLQVLKQEYYIVKNKLETLINMERQIGVAGRGSISITE